MSADRPAAGAAAGAAAGSAAPERIASIAMYRDPPEIAAATRALWAALRDRLRTQGLAQIPDRLDEAVAYDAAWRDPRLVLAQTCGYPFATGLRGRVRLVATPVYDHPGCAGVMSGSVVIVGAAAPVASLAALRGGIAACNDRASNSGMNLLRGLIARHARAGRFFGTVVISGSHAASIDLVARGAADVAAIDCVTFGNFARFAPARLAGVRILAETARVPGLPFITRAAASDGEVGALRAALAQLAEDPALAPLRATLGLRGFETLPDSAYDAVLAIEQAAIAGGYAELA